MLHTSPKPGRPSFHAKKNLFKFLLRDVSPICFMQALGTGCSHWGCNAGHPMALPAAPRQLQLPDSTSAQKHFTPSQLGKDFPHLSHFSHGYCLLLLSCLHIWYCWCAKAVLLIREAPTPVKYNYSSSDSNQMLQTVTKTVTYMCCLYSLFSLKVKAVRNRLPNTTLGR